MSDELRYNVKCYDCFMVGGKSYLLYDIDVNNIRFESYQTDRSLVAAKKTIKWYGCGFNILENGNDNINYHLKGINDMNYGGSLDSIENDYSDNSFILIRYIIKTESFDGYNIMKRSMIFNDISNDVLVYFDGVLDFSDVLHIEEYADGKLILI